MPEIPPQLRAGETVLSDYEGFYNWMMDNFLQFQRVHLWLTDQRLVLVDRNRLQRVFPLYQLVDIREEQHGPHTVVRLETVAGVVDLLSVKGGQPQFVAALRVARARAPEIPENLGEPGRPPAIQAFKTIWWVVIAALAGAFLCMLCLVGGYIALQVYLASLATH